MMKLFCDIYLRGVYFKVNNASAYVDTSALKLEGI